MRRATKAARKYITYLTTTAKGLILPAMVLIYVLSGTLDFATNVHPGILPAGVHNGVVTALYVCCILGFAKNGIMPLHHWLPGAMVAPTPVSALLHAVAVVKVGVFSTVRVMLHVFGVDLMARLNLGLPTAYFVSITILGASIIALSKDNLKTRLAYSTVSQLSYIILGVALLTPTGIEGGLVHIANHAFSKITLFFCAGAIYVAAHKKNISEMSGLGPVDAVDLRRLRPGGVEHDRRPAGRRVCDQAGTCWSARWMPDRSASSSCSWPARCSTRRTSCRWFTRASLAGRPRRMRTTPLMKHRWRW
jgi:formate hydrogenlyase subunit 3/multisubunit Na+/H+ antiporter MnhD subunit